MSESNFEIYKNGLKWLLAPKLTTARGSSYCETRDIFQGRLDKLYKSLTRSGLNAQEIPLVVAVLGEIGNNCFDHNIGHWKDVAGCFFDYEIRHDIFNSVIADRGQGLLTTLRHVDSTIDTPEKAITVAFSKKISGRAPENRGNGLKFVRSIINSNPKRYLYCFSGSGFTEFGGLSDFKKTMGDFYKTEQRPDWGTFTMLAWSLQ